MSVKYWKREPFKPEHPQYWGYQIIEEVEGEPVGRILQFIDDKNTYRLKPDAYRAELFHFFYNKHSIEPFSISQEKFEMLWDIMK